MASSDIELASTPRQPSLVWSFVKSTEAAPSTKMKFPGPHTFIHVVCAQLLNFSLL